MTEPTPKEVRFDLYCKKCEHEKLYDAEEPCNACLEQCWNEGTDQPINYKEKEK